MASCITEQFGNTYCPQVRLTVTQTSSSNTSVTLTWVLEYVAHGFAFYIGSRSYSVVINGSTVGSGTFAASGITGTAEIARGTKTINKTTSAQNISFSMSFAFNGSWNGVYGGTKSASGSISVAAKPSYKITYNANGGSGAPSAQTKWYGVNLTLSRSKPSRTGYSFLGWSTSSTATTATYSAGATYTANVSDTLYAVWKANTYTIKFNANGGSGAPANQTKTYGKTLTLSSTKPTRTNYNFKGWGTSASSTTVAYAAGARYTKNEAVTLYAIWELAYTSPRITELTSDRCTSNGSASEEGTYGLVKFKWETDKAVTEIRIFYKKTTDSGWYSITVTASGTSGTVNKVIGGSFDTEYLYNVAVSVSDSSGNTTLYTDIPAMSYTMDLLSGGKGIAFGKPAELEGFDIDMDIIIRKNCTIKKEKSDGKLIQIFDAGKVLWSGAYYMMGSQNITLSESVEDQDSGIVLHWQAYESNVVKNWDHIYTFIPKKYSGGGWYTFVLATSSLSYFAVKTVAITSTVIYGSDDNSRAPFTGACGIKSTPKHWVLTEVIGV